MSNKQVMLSCIGRFHHFHLARQMEKHGLLKAIYTGYPHFKLKDETGIPSEKIKTFPYLQAPFMRRHLVGLNKWEWLSRQWAWQAHETLDKYVASQIKTPGVLIALSEGGLHSGCKMKQLGGTYICDRGSSHIVYQDKLLREEHTCWNIPYKGIDARTIAKELKEYELADFITVPSEFARSSFIEAGFSEQKIVKIPYGARLDRFQKSIAPEPGTFRILWVGAISVQKGFLYLLDAFNKFSHANKELIVVGGISENMKAHIQKYNLQNVAFKGMVPNSQLSAIYSSSHVFVLSSIQEGLAMVQGEALACGCPVIATTNTGGADLFTDGIEGFIVPIRSSEAILEKLNLLASNPELRTRMSELAIEKVKSIGGWDKYGMLYTEFIKRITI